MQSKNLTEQKFVYNGGAKQLRPVFLNGGMIIVRI